MLAYSLYDPFSRMQFNHQTCFLCGAATSNAIPVFPNWLMEQYRFADKQLVLLDKSIIQYRDLTIPCCQECQTQFVNTLEDKIESAHANGYSGFKAFEEKDVFLWIAKMFYGILVRELLNEGNPLIKPEHSVGENPKMFTKFQSFFKLVQALRVPVVFDDFTPYSLFILDIDATEDQVPFEYRDELSTMVFSLKMGSVLLVCHLLDNGILTKALNPVWQDIAGKKLHPVQAAEFTARFYYAAYLLNIIPEFFERTPKNGEPYLIYDSLVDDITMPVFNPWDNSAYAKILEDMWGKWKVTREKILQNSNEPLSYIYDEAGNFRERVELKDY